MTMGEIFSRRRISNGFHLIGFSFWQAWWLVAMNLDVVVGAPVKEPTLLNPVFFLTAVTTLGYLFAVLLGRRIGPFSNRPVCFYCAGALACVGSLGLSLLSATDSSGAMAAVFIACTAAFAAGNALLLIMWGELWSTWASARVGTCLGASYTFAFVIYFVVAALPASLGALITCLLPLLSLFSLHRAQGEEKRHVTSIQFEYETVSPVRMAVPLVLVGALHGLFQGVIGMGANGREAMYLSQWVAGALLLVIVLYLLFRQPNPTVTALYKAIVPCYVTGLALMLLLPPSDRFVGNGFTLAAVFCVDMLVMLVSTDIAFRLQKPVAVLFGGALFCMRLGTTLGLFGVYGLSTSAVSYDEGLRMVTLIGIIVIVLLGCLVFTPMDLARLYKVKPSQGTGESAATKSRAVAEACGLTPRETEVLGYLVTGRSAPYIAGELFIAENTVKNHISSIYRKVGVSDRQSLIDVILQDAGD